MDWDSSLKNKELRHFNIIFIQFHTRTFDDEDSLNKILVLSFLSNVNRFKNLLCFDYKHSKPDGSNYKTELWFKPKPNYLQALQKIVT